MTQSLILAENIGSKTNKSYSGRQLHAAMLRHLSTEKASFHTPGHKGRLVLDIEPFISDLTELPGLDQLAEPSGVLQALQDRLAASFQAKHSFISINGASAALSAAILAFAHSGKKILLPRNVHRSALNALVLGGIEAIWYEPEWLGDWGTWGAVKLDEFKKQLLTEKDSLAAALVCSPAYSGAISDIKRISEICSENRIALIVDEAHGAHLISEHGYPASALRLGADLVVHSLHKTLTAPTQTGLLHIGHDSVVDKKRLQSCLNTLQSSSPSYLFLLAIEQICAELDGTLPASILELATDFRRQLGSIDSLELLAGTFQQDPLHIMIRHQSFSAERLNELLQERGIFAEAILGNAVLLLLGMGTNENDLELLVQALASLPVENSTKAKPQPKPVHAKQVMSPRQAFFADSDLVPSDKAVGHIACDWVAPCPPGYAIIAPGQEISAEIAKFFGNDTKLRVVKNYQPLEGDSDGPNTTS